MPGYSGTPLAKKLGYKSGMKVYLLNSPEEYTSWLVGLPEEVRFVRHLRYPVDLIHAFTTSKSELAEKLPIFRVKIVQTGTIWISWPKQAAKLETDITEDTIRELALPIGLVDVKVCSVSEIWSGLKLVIRKELRCEQHGSLSIVPKFLQRRRS